MMIIEVYSGRDNGGDDDDNDDDDDDDADNASTRYHLPLHPGGRVVSEKMQNIFRAGLG